MNNFLKYIFPLSLTLLFFSCNDEFVNEKINISGVATSAIIISPDWESDNYQFQYEETGNEDFVIKSKPDWMVIDNASGNFVNGIATIHMKANAEPRYSETGIYIDQMIISSENKEIAVPLYYISEGSPEVQTSQTLEINYNNYTNQMQITNLGDGILLWDIVSIPNWFSVNMNQFNFTSLLLGKDATATVPFTFNAEAAVQSDLNGTIVLKTNDEKNPIVKIAVSANLGTPVLRVFDEQINFGGSETTNTLNLYNHGEGILIWNFEQLPEWLTVSSANGLILPYSSSSEITFTCDRSMLKPGLNSASIYLKSNDANNSSVAINVKVRIPGISENVRTLDGNIVDATIDKSTNTLYSITGQPNKLVAYDIIDRKIVHEIALSKAPTCMAINEDFTKAMIGHGGMISVLNLNNFSIIETYETDHTIYDAEWAKDDWFCYTKANNTTSNLSWINTSNDETYETATDSWRLGTADLKKIPGQPYIIGARKNVSPSGIFVFDIETKTLKSYEHETIGNMWFFNGGELAVSGYSYIMRTSSITSPSGNSMGKTPTIGELKYGDYRYPAWWVDFSPIKHSIWAIFSYHSNSYFPPVNATIYEFEDNDYTLVKTYTFDNMFQPNTETAAYEVEARYVFSNKPETELTVLRKGKDNNNWSIEFIPIQ